MKYLKLICLMLALLSLVSCTSTKEYAQYLDEEHDVIVYDEYQYILAEGVDISSGALDNPSGNSVDLIDHDEKKPKVGHDFFGDFVLYSKNKTILVHSEDNGESKKFYIREDKYEDYIELLNGTEPPTFYLIAYIRDQNDVTSYQGTRYSLNEETQKILNDTIYYPNTVVPYEEYSMSDNFLHEGMVYGGEADREFYTCEYPLYYTDTYGFGIAVDDGVDVNFHLIPREYDEMIRESFYSEDGRFKTEADLSQDTQ